ncbi:MAG TPA: integration host factor subunit alpha [Candidatus Polarisedimenticolia bacterium]|nr:integration host factor subunit alpha [Candidatus Polarisedimenticolia bacterium]
MTKADLAHAIYQRHGALSRREATALVETVLERIRQGLSTGRAVKISGFGSFTVVHRKPRPGRNPRTGESVIIPGRVRPVFRPSRQVLLQLNRDGRPGRVRGVIDGH